MWKAHVSINSCSPQGVAHLQAAIVEKSWQEQEGSNLWRFSESESWREQEAKKDLWRFSESTSGKEGKSGRGEGMWRQTCWRRLVWKEAKHRRRLVWKEEKLDEQPLGVKDCAGMFSCFVGFVFWKSKMVLCFLLGKERYFSGGLHLLCFIFVYFFILYFVFFYFVFFYFVFYICICSGGLLFLWPAHCHLPPAPAGWPCLNVHMFKCSYV